MEEVRNLFARKIVLTLNVAATGEETIISLRKIFERHRGRQPCFFNVVGTASSDWMRFSAGKVDVELSDRFLEDVSKLIGDECVKLSQ